MEDPSTPAAEPDAEPAAGHAPTQAAGPPEDEGPLRLQRFRKPDGRALIIFERRGDA